MFTTAFRTIGASLLLGLATIANANVMTASSRQSDHFAYALANEAAHPNFFNSDKQALLDVREQTLTVRDALASNVRSRVATQVPCVPEPTTYALLGVGLVALLVMRRRPRSDVLVPNGLQQ